ncbi:MAG: ABC transporter substrate-binding protein [Nitriliruptorales bacterium]|nr:ABC transporter substrate-binding protein [Nitriliruptorales bacterium]
MREQRLRGGVAAPPLLPPIEGHPLPTPRRFAVALAVCALLVAACSGEDGDEGGSATPSPTATTEEATATQGAASPTEELQTGVGVTEEPCPDSIDAEKGCIYLGILSDLTQGPLAGLGQAVTRAQNAFWRHVNEQGGIAGRYEVNVAEYTRDNAGDPDTQVELFGEIEPNVLALAHTLGEQATDAILDQLRERGVVAAPILRPSTWAFEDVMVESGAPYCLATISALDYWVDRAERDPAPLMAVYGPDEYGRDGAAGAKLWAEANDVEFIAVPQTPTADGGEVASTVATILEHEPDVVLMAVSDRDLAPIVVGAADGGFDDRFIGLSPTWQAALVEHPDFDVLAERYWHVTPWGGHWGADVAAFNDLRAALDDVAGNDQYLAGWVSSYPLLAALEAAAANGDLTREGLLAAVTELESVDYRGALPEGAGNFAGDSNAQTGRAATVSRPDAANPSGLTAMERLFTGSTAEELDVSAPCDELVTLDE